MARLTLQKLFRSMAFKPKNIRRKLHHSTLFLETFEERIVPALPPPSVILESTQLSEEPFEQQFPSAANNETTINYIADKVLECIAVRGAEHQLKSSRVPWVKWHWGTLSVLVRVQA